jgi:hypothetical protein
MILFKCEMVWRFLFSYRLQRPPCRPDTPPHIPDRERGEQALAAPCAGLRWPWKGHHWPPHATSIWAQRPLLPFSLPICPPWSAPPFDSSLPFSLLIQQAVGNTNIVHPGGWYLRIMTCKSMAAMAVYFCHYIFLLLSSALFFSHLFTERPINIFLSSYKLLQLVFYVCWQENKLG